MKATRAAGDMCADSGKECLSKSQAKTLAKRIAKRQKRSARPGPMIAFLCFACNRWHVGHRVDGMRKM